MHALLAFLLASAPFALAGSSVKSKAEGRNVEDGAAKAQTSEAPAQNAAYPEGVPADTTWFDSPRLKDLPEKVGGHRIVRVAMKKVGWAVGFMTNAGFPAGERRSGVFGTAPTPGAGTNAACEKHMWIASRVGGGPLAGCYVGPIGGASPVTLTWLALGADAPKLKPGDACVLEAGRRYYAHYTASGWDRTDEHKPKHCDTLIAGSLSYVPD